MRINHNIASMVTQGALYSVTQAESKSLQRLSTGLRINSASDDAAGLGVSENLRTQVTGLQQAQKNTQDAISLLNIADGALNEQANILQRMRELTIQAKNDTYTSTERGYMGSEFDALFNELDRIAAVTNYNNMQIFATPETDYIGTANAGQTVYAQNDLNASPHELTDERTIFSNQNQAFGGGTDYTSSTHFNFLVGANYTAQDAAQYNNASGAWNPGSGDMITVQFTQMDTNALFSPAPDTADASLFLMTGGNNPFGWDPVNDPGDQALSGWVTSHTATIQDKLGFIQDLIDGNPVANDIETNFFQANSAGPATNLTGLKRVNTMRADIGAMINRLQDSVNNDQTGAANQQAAESQIRDVDFASETASFTKEQILTQSATAMLAQANSVPQSVLQLLK
jgi:flagellin